MITSCVLQIKSRAAPARLSPFLGGQKGQERMILRSAILSAAFSSKENAGKEKTGLFLDCSFL